MLTLNKLKEMQPKIIFATGTCINSPEDIYMTDSNIGKEMRWIAKRGGIHDWAIYIFWSDKNEEWVEEYGDKIKTEKNIKKLVPCDDEAFAMYRF